MLYDTRWDATVQPLLPEQRILLDAADLLEKDGWCLGQTEDIFGRHCAVGAICVVQGKLPVDGIFLVEWGAAGYYARNRLRSVIQIELGGITRWKGITRWNDASGRTKEEVVAALRDAAR